MGTSTHNGGQKGNTSLVPSWLGQPDGSDLNNTDPALVPQIGTPDRFTQSRSGFTRYINSGGRNSDQAKRSISRYINHSLGGSTNATRRMGAARSSTAKLVSVFGMLASGGVQAVEQFLSIKDIGHRNATEAFLAIADFICPDGGTQDEGIARNAYFSAIEDSPELAEMSFESLTSEQMLLIVERSMANAICARITNDIGNKIISLPESVSESDALVEQIKEYVSGAVSDAIARLDLSAGNIPKDKSLKIVDTVYKAAFDIMASVGEDE